MSSSRLVRGAKTRMFAVVCLICVLGAVVFVFHGTQSKLAEVQKLVNNCNQQQESLSAQLQVIFEYKVRLEKSLHKEKADHKQTKDTLEVKLAEEKKNREKDILESKNKCDALLQEHKFLQNQVQDLQESSKKEISQLTEESNKLKNELELLKKDNTDLVAHKNNLKTEYLKQQEELKELNKEIDILKGNSKLGNLEKENIRQHEEIDQLKKKLNECERGSPKGGPNGAKEPARHQEPQSDTNVGEMPKFLYAQKINGSTTPGLNPEAVNNFEISSPKPVSDNELPKKHYEQMARLPKKPTQESVMPLALPRHAAPGLKRPQGETGVRREEGAVGQIPQPLDPLANTLHKPRLLPPQELVEDSGGVVPGVDSELEQPRLFVPAPPPPPGELGNRAAEEEDEDRGGPPASFQRKQGDGARLKNGESYHGGEYDREQPEEEDEEGEQVDYEGGDRGKKEPKGAPAQQSLLKSIPDHEGGVMVNPK